MKALPTLSIPLAISKAPAGPALTQAREKLDPGEYQVDATVRVTGVVRVGEDYTQRITANANPWGLLAVALSKLNSVTVESLVREADRVAAGVTKDIQARATSAIQEIKAATERTCAGKVTHTLTLETLGVGPELIEQAREEEFLARLIETWHESQPRHEQGGLISPEFRIGRDIERDIENARDKTEDA